MKVALVYDRVNKWGGAERVLLALHELWPEAPLYTSVYDQKLAPWADVFDVRTSFIQRLPLPKNEHENYPFLMGIAFEGLDFSNFDIVISVTSEFAKAIITKPWTLHLCYCLNPTGYIWSGYDSYFSSRSQTFRTLISPLVSYLRAYDLIVAHRPDRYLAISKTVQRRIQKYYDQESEVIYPPVNMPPQQHVLEVVSDTAPDRHFFLIVARLVPNKRVDIAVKAFNDLGLPLKIVGVGVEEARLKSIARPNIEFLGNLTEEKLSSYYERCSAVIVPAEEDFGIVAVEAQSYGKPVIAYGKGGVTETVGDSHTGWYFNTQKPEDLVRTVRRARLGKINPEVCRKNAQRFSKTRFLREFKKIVEKEWQQFLRYV